MQKIRKAVREDASRLAEILIFTKRMNYRSIFQNDQVSFGEMQVYPLAQDYLDHPEKLENIWVYDDGFVKGLVHVEGQELRELYVDHFFQSQGVGGRLLDFAVEKLGAAWLYVLEKNPRAQQFYRNHGFSCTDQLKLEPGTTEYVRKMERE